MAKVKKILWIDDDLRRPELSIDIDEFNENGFEIIIADNPDECSEIIAKRHDFECIIIDISMPLGKSIDFGEAKGGMRTGLIVLKNLVNNKKLKKIQKIVYTIADDDEVRDYCEDNNIPYLRKQMYLSDTFVDEVKHIISQQTSNKKQH